MSGNFHVAVVFSNFLERDKVFFERLSRILSSFEEGDVDGIIFVPKNIYHSKMKRLSSSIHALEYSESILRKTHCLLFQEPWFKIGKIDWNILCKKIYQFPGISYIAFKIMDLQGNSEISPRNVGDLVNHMVRSYPELYFLYTKGIFKSRGLKSVSLDSYGILKDWEHLMFLEDKEWEILSSDVELSLDRDWILKHQSFMKKIFLRSFVKILEDTSNIIKKMPDFVVLDFVKKIFYLFEIEQWDGSLVAEVQREDFRYNRIDYQPLIEMTRGILGNLKDEVVKERMESFVEYLEDLFDPRNKPLVSILIPAYNQLRFFKEALDSAMNQTYPNVEIVIGDDSTNTDIKDYISNSVESYGLRQGLKLRYFFLNRKTHEDFGAYNKSFLFKTAGGNYISYLSHDDVIHPEKIRIMMHFLLLEPEVKLVTSYRKLIIEENEEPVKLSSSYKRFSNRLIIDDGLAFGRLLLKTEVNYIGEPSTAMFRKEDSEGDFGDYKGWRARMADDIAQWLKLLGKGIGVYIPVPLNFTRIHKSQLTWDLRTELVGTEDFAEMLFRSAGEFITHYEVYVILMKVLEGLENMRLYHYDFQTDHQEKILSLYKKCKSYLEKLRNFILRT